MANLYHSAHHLCKILFLTSFLLAILHIFFAREQSLIESAKIITNNYRQVCFPNYRMTFPVSRIVQVSMSIIALGIVSMQMIDQSNEQSLLVMDLGKLRKENCEG